MSDTGRPCHEPPAFADVINTARKEQCDLNVMASHGRKGVSRPPLGSETDQVLTPSRVPVLVAR